MTARTDRGTYWSAEDFQSLPTLTRGECTREGYIYVLAFSTGVVKVGRTNDPRSRVPHHVGDAEKFGHSVHQFWLSPIHRDHMENERELISWCGAASDATHRSEYFEGISFAETVRFAQSLDFARMTAAEHAERDAEQDRLRARFRSAIDAVTTPSMERQVTDLLFGGPTAWASLGRILEGAGSADERDELVARLAAALDRDPTYVSSMSYIDLLAQCAHSFIKLAAANMTVWAYENGRTDMTQRMILQPA